MKLFGPAFVPTLGSLKLMQSNLGVFVRAGYLSNGLVVFLLASNQALKCIYVQ